MNQLTKASPVGLWKHRDFLRFWIGQSVSQFGNQITLLALPTIAILVLRITVFQVGLLGAIEFLAFPAIGLFVGVWVDRIARKPVLMICNLGRFISLATIPAAYLLNSLSLTQLYAIAGINGIFTVFFEVAYQAYLPSLIEADQLLEGNSKLQTSASAATITGPSIAGFLIGLVGAALSVIVDAIGYLVSVLALATIKKPEEISKTTSEERSFASELREGVNTTVHNPVLATLTGCVATSNLGNTIAQSVYLYFAYNQLHLTPLQVGFVGTSTGLAFLSGSLVAGRVSKKLGIGKTLTLAILSGAAWIGFPLALVFPALPTLILFSFLLFFGVVIFNIVAVSMIQRVTPNRLLGRMTATRRTISWGIIPVGLFLGGLLGGTIGLATTMVIGGLIAGASILWAFLGPIYRLKQETELDSFAVLRTGDPC